MTFNPNHYPKDWKHLREQVLARAEGRCECRSHCGADHVEFDEPTRCDAPNGALIQRRREHIDQWVPAYASSQTNAHHKPIKVVLTTAHTCQESGCADLTYLLALCQFCHLNLDKGQHAATRKRNRAQKVEAAR